MQVLQGVDELRARIRHWRQLGQNVALVPTMGNLHPGHLRLVEQAKARAERCVVSIFVNPLQFGPQEDFDSYPRTLEDDRLKLADQGADVLFVPSVKEVYPRSLAAMTRIEVPGLSTILCGAARPGHFAGVATVVTKLFNMVQPDMAVFGEKDWQQLLVIRRLTADLNLPITIVGVSTHREADGLAMSSRNAYLSDAERCKAPLLYASLKDSVQRLLNGDPDYPGIEMTALVGLREAGFRPDYFLIRRATDLTEPQPGDTDLIVIAAAWLGKTRLIDNYPVALEQLAVAPANPSLSTTR
ncbi:MAG: pantoate--beta-alanine ligase [Gammaproteobacteria bacterium]|nr:pantoate--beta-alanine ligase [Gammaproteobacteria bacterium]